MTVAWLGAAVAVIALLAGMVWMAAPLWRGAPDAVGDDPRLVGLLAEREAVLATLRDLDADAHDGRLAPADHAALRAEAVARGAAILAALDALPTVRSAVAESATDAVETDVAAWRDRRSTRA